MRYSQAFHTKNIQKDFASTSFCAIEGMQGVLLAAEAVHVMVRAGTMYAWICTVSGDLIGLAVVCRHVAWVLEGSCE
jgi:hypothetical protein